MKATAMKPTFEDVRLLILDDESDICQVIEAAAERAGVNARSTIHAGEFAVLCESWKPTHLVIDLAMPGTDGLTMLRLLAQAD